MKAVCIILLIGALGGFACAQKRSPAASSQPAQPVNAKAQLTLSHIEPEISLPATQPGEDDSPAPLESLELFARARGALFDNQPYSAIQLLEKAIALDAESFELRYLLARAYSAINDQSEKAIASLEAAVRLNPQSLEAQTDLGKQYFAAGKYDPAQQTLRRARLTQAYIRGDDYAAITDYYLARAMQQLGYQRAAVDCYEKFLERLKYARPSFRNFPELAFFERRPDGLYNQLGKLYEELGDDVNALRCYEFVAERNPREFAAQAAVVKTLVELNRKSDAVAGSRKILRDFRATKDSIELLQWVNRQTDGRDTLADELRAILKESPGDRSVLFALSDTLQQSGRVDEARWVLRDALQSDPNEVVLIRRLFSLEITRGDASAAARLLIEQSARSREAFSEISSLWERLLNDPSIPRIEPEDLERLRVVSEAEPARFFWISQQASLGNRVRLARSSLAKSIEAGAFAPAYRTAVYQTWSRIDFNAQEKIAACEELAAKAQAHGAQSVALEVQAMSLVNQGQAAAAQPKLLAALEHESSPDLLLSYAQTLRITGDSEKYEQKLWKLISDFPQFPAGFQALINLAVEKSNGQMAQRVMQTWISQDPESVQARLFQSAIYRLAGEKDVAEGILLQLLRDQPWNSEVLGNFRAFYQHANQNDDLIKRLEEVRVKEPRNRLILRELTDLLAQQQRTSEASRLIDDYVSACRDDPDRLYYAAPLYRSLDQQSKGDEILERVLRINPRHAGANNDLGYNWADEGLNLDRAEAMIRIAVEREPDNESFLDSLGWVLYKRGRFAEARTYLQKAIAPGVIGDPITLDHLGDVNYQLNEPVEATRLWNLAKDRVAAFLQAGESRKELLNLQLALQNKLKQIEQGVAVTTAPVVEAPENANQVNKTTNP